MPLNRCRLLQDLKTTLTYFGILSLSLKNCNDLTIMEKESWRIICEAIGSLWD